MQLMRGDITPSVTVISCPRLPDAVLPQRRGPSLGSFVPTSVRLHRPPSCLKGQSAQLAPQRADRNQGQARDKPQHAHQLVAFRQPAGIRATRASDTTLGPAATRQWGPMRRFERWHQATERCATQPSAVGSAPSHWRRFAGGRLAHRGSPESMLLGGQSSAAEGTIGPWQLRKRTQHAEVIRLVFSRALVGGNSGPPSGRYSSAWLRLLFLTRQSRNQRGGARSEGRWRLHRQAGESQTRQCVKRSRGSAWPETCG